MALTEHSIQSLNDFGRNTMGEHLGIEITEIGKDYLCGKMPVDQRTKQPFGLLHGGASCVLAETLGSLGSACIIDLQHFNAVGIEINANHLRSAREGFVHGKAQLLHEGRKIHVWDIKINSDEGKLLCVSRLTVAIIPK
jgi:1,4-dihydroxy-2-naphthoyl-CoA hydrolase